MTYPNDKRETTISGRVPSFMVGRSSQIEAGGKIGGRARGSYTPHALLPKTIWAKISGKISGWVLAYRYGDVSQWHVFTGGMALWHPVMRRRVCGVWQFREMTAEEQYDWLLSEAW